MTKFDINRKNLYEDLLGLGYFKDEDGTINFSFEDFNASMSEPDVARTLYSNLLSDGFYQDDQGQPTISEGEFVESLCDTREKKEYYPITENQRGLYIDWEMNRDTTQYNIPSVNRLDGVSADDLRQAIIISSRSVFARSTYSMTVFTDLRFIFTVMPFIFSRIFITSSLTEDPVLYLRRMF